MKTRVNLAGRKKQVAKTKFVVVRVFWVVMGLSFVVFLSFTGFALFRTYKIKQEISTINSQAVLISNDIRNNNEAVSNFVLSKGILDQIERINAGKFAYKRYMDEIVSILPLNAVLRNVDFQNKGWVVVSVFIPDLATARLFEERITDKTIIDQTVFSTIFSEGLVKDKSGGYLIKLQFELKKND